MRTLEDVWRPRVTGERLAEGRCRLARDTGHGTVRYFFSRPDACQVRTPEDVWRPRVTGERLAEGRCRLARVWPVTLVTAEMKIFSQGRTRAKCARLRTFGARA